MNVTLSSREIPRLKGGWNTSPDEYRQIGYTPGLPPGLYATHTTQIQRLSNIFESGGILSQYPEGESSKEYSRKSITVFNSPNDENPHDIANYLIDLLISRGIVKEEMKPDVKYFDGTNAFVIVFKEEEEASKTISLRFEISYKGIPLDIRPFRKQNEMPMPPVNIVTHHPRRVIVMNVDNPIKNNFFEFLCNFFKMDGYLVVKDFNDCVMFDVEPPMAAEAAAFIIDGLKFGNDKIIARALRSVFTRKNSDKYGELSVLSQGVNLQQIIQTRTTITELTDSPVNSIGKKLYMFNVIPVSVLKDAEECQTLIFDIVNECKKYGSVENCKLSNEKVNFGKYCVAIITFQMHESALLAQQNISGRYFLGRIVITTISD